MTEKPRVASVVLVARPSRQRVLVPVLRVVGEPVGYALDAIEPRTFTCRVARDDLGLHDLIVVDGESADHDDEREVWLRFARMSSERLSSVLYIFGSAPRDLEVQAAYAYADDTIEQGWDFRDRLRRRVQVIGLAHWRRSTALRLAAMRLGDRRLELVRREGAR